jgi:hypothetical protein
MPKKRVDKLADSSSNGYMTNSTMLKNHLYFQQKQYLINLIQWIHPMSLSIYIVMFSLVPRRGNLLEDKVISDVNMSL